MTDWQTDVDQAVARGIAYLAQHQYPNGEFCCYMAPDDAMQDWCVPDSTVFPTALIANALLSVADVPAVDQMLSRTVGFLEYQMGRGCVWNHFTNWHPLHRMTPSDADDTVCVSTFLKTYRQAHFPNEPLLLANRNAQGLFYTWFVLRPRWITNRTYWRITLPEALHPIRSFVFWQRNDCTREDTDAVVNANVLYYLGATAATQPVIAHLLRIVAERREATCDKWYPNPFTVYYFLSRNYDRGIAQLEPARQPVVDRILASAKPNGQLGDTELDTALGISTLLNWRSNPPELARAVDFLLQAQRPTGEWTRRLLYYSGPKRVVGWGSEELTTAFCVEALARYGRQSAPR